VRFGTAELMRDADRPNAWLLVVDGVPQSYVDLDDPTYLDFTYVRLMGDVVDSVAPVGEPLDVVHLGAGAATLPRYVAATRPGSRQTVVDHDGRLLDLVRGPLGLDDWPHVSTLAADAREALDALPSAACALVAADVFAGSALPAHVTTLEFLVSVRRVLRVDGVYVLNVADRQSLPFARAQAATLQAVFPDVTVTAEPGVLRGRRLGNLVLTGSGVPLPVAAMTRRAAGGAFPARVLHGDALVEFVGDAEPVIDANATPPPAPDPSELEGWGG